MKFYYRLFILLLFFNICACSKHIPAVYEVVGMNLRNSNSSGETPIDTLLDSIPKGAYAIKMILKEEMRKKTDGDAQENGFINEDQLLSLKLISLNNFDSTHPAGSTLNSYFLTQLNLTSTVEAYVSNGQFGSGKYKDGNYTDSWTSEEYFYLMHTPTLRGKYNFVVEMELSDGRKMIDTVTAKLY